MGVRYRDRRHAGEVLADALAGRQWQQPLVLALPRGGVRALLLSRIPR